MCQSKSSCVLLGAPGELHLLYGCLCLSVVRRGRRRVSRSRPKRGDGQRGIKTLLNRFEWTQRALPFAQALRKSNRIAPEEHLVTNTIAPVMVPDDPGITSHKLNVPQIKHTFICVALTFMCV